MDEKDWLILKTLYEKKSITQTAAALFMSQPALSSRLQQIEGRFDAVLVVRSKKGVQFTSAGEYLVKGAYEMLKRMQEFEEHIQDMAAQPTGVLRIGASNFFTKYLLPEMLRQFKELYPGIDFKVTSTWSRDVVNLVLNKEVHIGFLRGDYSWPGEKELLFEERMYVAAFKPLDMGALPSMPRIDYRNDYTTQLLLDKWWNDHYDVPPAIGMEVDRVDTCKEMVEKGLGYGFLPEMILEEGTGLHTSEMRYKSGDPVLRRTWMVYHKETLDLKLVKAFVDFVHSVQFID